ncbi:MAG: hypothetical protein WC995_14590 [Lysobacteraceae bacterium]
MKFRLIKSNTIALLLSGVLVLAVGTYTENGGFQLAGGIMLLAAAILAFNHASDRSGKP